MMKVIPLVFTQRMYKSKVETKFLFYNPLHIRRDLLSKDFPEYLKCKILHTKISSVVTNVECVEYLKDPVNIPGLMVNIAKIIFVMSFFRGKITNNTACLCLAFVKV